MSARRRLLVLAYWGAVALLATAWSRAIYGDALARPVCAAAPCPEPGSPGAEAAGLVLAGGQFLVVLLAGVLVYGLAKLARFLWTRRSGA
ncbi:MAG: hypothetical protein K1X35_06040 [Caulobacteraceae bacterium]|nr:hypothetical protein [Caulobacteraceae bacterium]